MGRVLAIDPGERWVGLALTDPEQRIALAHGVLEGLGRQRLSRELARLVAEQQVERVIVGLPLRLDGSRGPAAQRALALASRLERQLGRPVETFDERFTTAEARQRLGRHASGRLDAEAARVLLEDWLAARSEERA